MKRFLLTLFVSLLSVAVWSQVWIPVTESDAVSCRNYSQKIKDNSFHSSVTWKVTVKDNVISRTKVLFSETYYNENGQPSRIVYFGEGNRPKSFVIVKYNSRNLPFEEVNFTADSVMIGGTIYEYNNDNMLSSQISYVGNSVTSNYRIERMADSIVVSEVDSLGKVISNGSISSIATDQKELVFRRAQNPEITNYDYDILSEVTRKHIVGGAEKKVFIYENDKVVKTSVFDRNNEEISSASLEYDRFGNISRIIERREKDGATNVYMINYR
ncbi:MAG: hypothetical protein J6S84_03360 [Bacteroidales bacterium]|nr:hypothetical protein [Bacteroidales bacterium]